MQTKSSPQELRDGEMEGRRNVLVACIVIGLAMSVAPFRDFLIYTSAITLVLYLVIGGSIIFRRIKTMNLKVDAGDAVGFLIAFFVLPILGMFFYSSWTLLKAIYLWQMAEPQSGIFRPMFGAVITLLLGVSLFGFRKGARGLYGLTEVVAGVSIAAYRISTENTDLLNASPEIYIVLLTAGVYLVVRGLDNMEKESLSFGLGAFGIRLAKE